MLNTQKGDFCKKDNNKKNSICKGHLTKLQVLYYVQIANKNNFTIHESVYILFTIFSERDQNITPAQQYLTLSKANGSPWP